MLFRSAIATASVDEQTLVDQLLEFVMELAASTTTGSGSANVLDAAMLDKALALLQSTVAVNARAMDCLVGTLLKTADVYSSSAPLFYLLDRTTHLRESSAMSRRLRAFFSSMAQRATMRQPILETCLHILTTSLNLDSGAGDSDEWADPQSPKRGGAAGRRNNNNNKAGSGGTPDGNGNSFFSVLEEYLAQIGRASCRERV